ncbi:cysteine--tRNA ligase [Patescibacteria group bacterium]|nr:cysteine--tRNA ligase [Patescibacteria group bacterium]MBU1889946.1 cysteine--tRNA ligase [Patescibacteria group bacterium]
MKLEIYNTLTRKKEEFNPLNKTSVSYYACGPTVYNYAHIGNLRTYIFEDILKRVLLFNNLKVKHVMNITDVGHLTSDADEGDDKVELGAKREGKTAKEIADYYTNEFKKNLKDLNILPPDLWPKASEHIKEQIDLVTKLEKNGYTYKTSDGIYFDSSKFKGYEILAKLDIQGLKEGARVQENKEKKNITDFALWKFSPKGKKRQMEWDSPWGIGFPGWHIECSAMSMKHLGNTIDIHAGGIDHLPVHHTNEIAQSEAATGQQFVRFWVHGEFLLIRDDRMSKSKENFITLDTLKEKKYSPLAFRYMLLMAHYRSRINFSWKALTAAQVALDKLRERVYRLGPAKGSCPQYEKRFIEAINDDLNTPQALAIVWDLIKSKEPAPAIQGTLQKFDQVLGLGLRTSKKDQAVPKNVQEIIKQREQARQNKDWALADKLRGELEKLNYKVEDSKKDTIIKKY